MQVKLPNRSTFVLIYKRSKRVAIPPNIELNRPYKQIPALKNKHKRYPAAQQ